MYTRNSKACNLLQSSGQVSEKIKEQISIVCPQIYNIYPQSSFSLAFYANKLAFCHLQYSVVNQIQKTCLDTIFCFLFISNVIKLWQSLVQKVSKELSCYSSNLQHHLLFYVFFKNANSYAKNADPPHTKILTMTQKCKLTCEKCSFVHKKCKLVHRKC